MAMTSINEVKFGSINDKKYYGSDGIVSLAFGHYLLKKLENIKNPSQKFILWLKERKIKFLNLKMMRSVKAIG